MTDELLDRVRVGVDHIEDHLHEPLALRSISRAAGMSHSSFQRTFRAVTSESLKRYVRARRLSHALDLLETTDLRVLDIGFAAGYATQESFARVFKTTMGITPTQYRDGQRARAVLKKARIDDDYLRHLGDGLVSDEPVIEHRDELRVVGVSTRFDGEERQKNELGEDLDSLWGRFLPLTESIPDILDGPFYGVISDPEDRDDELEYLAAVPSNAPVVDRQFQVSTVPAGTWAVFAHRGLATDIDHTVNYIYGSWLMRSPHEHAGGPDLEMYGHEWKLDSPDSVFYYGIPLA